MSSGLSAAEWAVVEALAECHSLMSEIDGLDFVRFDAAIQGLQEQVLALPVRRAMEGRLSAAIPRRRFPGRPE